MNPDEVISISAPVKESRSPLIRVGISSCLLGMKVRFDGGHKHDNYLTQTLGRYFTWVPVCPEVEMGMPVPREVIRLVGPPQNPRLIAPKSNTDYTQEMNRFTARRLQELEMNDLHGYILKKDSPSCGMERVKIYDDNNVPTRDGVGIYAAELMKKFPLLPVEEEGRLNDPRLRENFIERVFEHFRIRQFLNERPSLGRLVEFHTQRKLTLMAHSISHMRDLGKLVASAEKSRITEIQNSYVQIYMQALRIKSTTKKQVNVMHHIIGYFKKKLDSLDKHELVDQIEQYRLGYVPLVVPLTLIRHHLNRHPVSWLQAQIYLNPYPSELMLRNFI